MATLFARAATELTVAEVGEELVIEATRKPTRREAVLSAVGAGVFVVLLTHQRLGFAVLMLVAVLAALLMFWLAIRTARAELRVTRIAFKSRGPFAGELGYSRNVTSGDIQWLEYQKEESGGEGRAGGLYAVVGRRSICLLPDLDRQQTDQLIDRIEAKFPDLYEQRRRADPFGERFTTLKLNEPQ